MEATPPCSHRTYGSGHQLTLAPNPHSCIFNLELELLGKEYLQKRMHVSCH